MQIWGDNFQIRQIEDGRSKTEDSTSKIVPPFLTFRIEKFWLWTQEFNKPIKINSKTLSCKKYYISCLNGCIHINFKFTLKKAGSITKWI